MTTTLRNTLIANAQSLPDLVAKAQTFDPALASALTGKATMASKTPLGALLAAVIGMLAAHYGLGWGEATDSLIAGACVLAGGYITHRLTNRPLIAATTPTQETSPHA